ncbi:MAG: class A beta-lactamase [Pyrinomonadaceae bacterium]
MRSPIATLLLASFFYFGCSRIAPQVQFENANTVATTDTPKTETPTPTPRPTPTPNIELQKEIADLAKEAKGNVGVYAVVIETGDSVGLDENGRFALQSVVKLPVSMSALKMVDDGKLRLDQLVNVEESDLTTMNQKSPIRDQNPMGTQMFLEDILKAAVSESDGTASDVLQRLAGGAPAVQAYVESLGIRDMKIVWSHKQFSSEWSRQYDNWTTPVASVELLRKLWASSSDPSTSSAISKSSADLLLKFMTDSHNPKNRILGMLPKGTIVAHKTGTGGRQDGITSVIADVAIITLPNEKHLAIAVYVGDSTGSGVERADAIAKIAKAAFDTWSGVPRSKQSNASSSNGQHSGRNESSKAAKF